MNITDIAQYLTPEQLAICAFAVLLWHLWLKARPYVVAALKQLWIGLCVAWPWVVAHGGVWGVIVLTLCGAPKLPDPQQKLNLPP